MKEELAQALILASRHSFGDPEVQQHLLKVGFSLPVGLSLTVGFSLTVGVSLTALSNLL